MSAEQEIRSTNTIDLRVCRTADTKDMYEYVIFYFPAAVSVRSIRIIAVDAKTKLEIPDPFFHCRAVSKAYPRTAEESLPPSSPTTTEIIFEIKYGSPMHKQHVLLHAVGTTVRN